MKITNIRLNNFRAAKSLEIDLHQQMNLFVGVNGSGKSTVLQAIAAALKIIVRKVDNSKKRPAFLHSSDVRQNEEFTAVGIGVNFDKKSYSWNLVKILPGRSSPIAENHEELETLVKALKKTYQQKHSLPVLAYYPVGRVIERTPVIRRKEPKNGQLDVYDNALDGTPNFHNFFNWFRVQDDFINQELLSGDRWRTQISSRLQSRISEIIGDLRQLTSPMDDYRLRKILRTDMLINERRIFRELCITFRDSTTPQVADLGDFLYRLYLDLDMLSSEETRSRLGEVSLSKSISAVLSHFYKIQEESNHDTRCLSGLWELLMLDFEFGLWWLSENGRSHLINQLRTMQPQDLPTQLNELEFTEKMVGTIQTGVNSDLTMRSKAKDNFGKDVNYVTQAIEKFVPEYSNLRIHRSKGGLARMLVDKHGQEFDIGKLSDGEKNLIALIGDIARRLTIGNPDSTDPLAEPGVILIDEIELHLHPKWQRLVADRLVKVFPNCQFIISSHSPQIISHIKPESILILRNDDGVISQHTVNESYGKSSDRILEDIMDESSRPKYISEEINSIFDLIQNRQLDDARKKIDELRDSIGEDGELVKAGVLIKRQEIIGK